MDADYSNMSPVLKPQSREKRAAGDKRGCIRLMIAISVLLFLSLLANVVLTYLYCKIKSAPCPPPLAYPPPVTSPPPLVCPPPVTSPPPLTCPPPLACPPSLQEKKCTAGQPTEVQDRDRLYVFSQDKLPWSSSRERCKELGGDLAIVDSKEHDFLGRMVTTVGNSNLHWIGLTDAETEGVWLWVDQTPLLKNLTWWGYPPDDWQAHDPLGEDCAVYYNNKWADVSCSTMEKRICEIPCTHDSY